MSQLDYYLFIMKVFFLKNRMSYWRALQIERGKG